MTETTVDTITAAIVDEFDEPGLVVIVFEEPDGPYRMLVDGTDLTEYVNITVEGDKFVISAR